MTSEISQIHDAFDKKTLSPVELARDFIVAAKKSDHNAYLFVSEEKAIAQAKEADRVLAREGKVPREKMPLLGIPIALKDILVTEGVRTTCGSKMLESYVPPYSATVVRKLEAAGAVCLGKLNLDEFAMGSTNENSAFGPVQHPTHRGRVPGGSSGGSAAAVRAKLCVASVGTDTGGSIRLPAHYCGVVGVKPTYGRVSRFGLIAFASSLDQAGPLAPTVEDAATMLDAMCGHDPKDSTSSREPSGKFAAASRQVPDWKGLRIGVPNEFFGKGLSADVEKAIRGSLSWMEKQGAKLVPISLPHAPHSIAVYYLVAVSEASSNLARFDGIRYGYRPDDSEVADLASLYKKARSRFGAEVKRRIILGAFALSAGYADAYYQRACRVRRLIQKDFFNAFEKVDLIAGPVSPTTAFKIGEKVSDPLQMYLNDIYTIPPSLAGLPAMSLPCGEDPQGLPIGLHLIAPPFAESRMLSVAGAFERGRHQ